MNKMSTVTKKPKILSGIEEKVVHVPPLTIKKLVDKLVEIEKDQGYSMALVAVETLNYVEVSKLACQSGKDNDPNLMPSRFMILYGANDGKLKENKNLDKFPHELHDDIKEEMSVERLRALLGMIGYYQGPWRHLEEDQDEEEDAEEMEHDLSHTLTGDLFGAVCQYIQKAEEPFAKPLAGGTYTTGKGESLSDIAAKHGIRNWRILQELNKNCLGDTHDIVMEGKELKLPDTSKNTMLDWLEEHGWKDPYAASKGYQYPGKYFSLTIQDHAGKVAEFEGEGRRVQAYLVHPRPELVVDVKIKKGDEIDFVAPDSDHLAIWISGYSIPTNGRFYPDFNTFLKTVDPQTENDNSGGGDLDPSGLAWGAPDDDDDSDDAALGGIGQELSRTADAGSASARSAASGLQNLSVPKIETPKLGGGLF